VGAGLAYDHRLYARSVYDRRALLRAMRYTNLHNDIDTEVDIAVGSIFYPTQLSQSF